MKLRAVATHELTPDARIARAKRLLSEAVGEMVEAHLAKGLAASEWVDQNASPLGKSRHLRLARKGTLPGVREGHRVLIRRETINAYLEEHPIVPKPVEEDDVDGMIRAITAGAQR